MDEQTDIEQRIIRALEEVSPFLKIDNGDIEFVRYEKDNRVAVVRFLGMCAGCPMSIMTLRAGIERYVLKVVPEVRRIESVQ